MTRRPFLGASAVLLTLVARPAFAQTMEDIEAKLKWLQVEVVHYKVVGDYAGSMHLLTSASQYVDGDVTDHIEIEFDWNQKTRALVGTPVIRNAATKVVKVGTTNTEGCPGSPKIDGAPEFLTGVSVTAGTASVMGYLVLEGRRELATGSFPTKNDAGCGTDSAKAASEPVTLELQAAVSPTLLLAPPSDITRATADKKSIVMVLKTKGLLGWTWTITPTAK